MSTYTVKSTMPTGKEHEKFGKEFYVQFNEAEQAFPLWFKEAPEIGKTIDGEITNGKFKKVKKEWNPNPAAQNHQVNTTDLPAGTQTAPYAKPAYKDNSDGMRQGMCFNNAANYVNTMDFPQALTDREWAETVFAYAQALYRKGDLAQAPEGSQDALSTVKAVFGDVKVAPING